jgi:hypothetical protein
MSKLELIAIKKNDKYYVRHKTEKYFTFGNLVFDVEQSPSFSENWIVFEKLPLYIQRKSSASNKVIGYRLKDGYIASDKAPLNVPADYFEYLGDEDYRNSDVRGLYDSILELIPEKLEDIELNIEVIDEDCEPLIKPKYSFISDFPYFIENHEAVRHKYPCHIEAQELFNLIKQYVIFNLPEHCRITSNYNFHFCVELIVPLLHEETYQKNISRMNAKKQTYQTVPLRSIQFKIIDIGIPGEKYGKDIIRGISANNYAELESAVDMLLQTYKVMMMQKLSVCPHCKGYGFQIDAHDSIASV